MAQPMMQDPNADAGGGSGAAGAGAADEPDTGGGYTIEISVIDDGKISVGVETAAEEDAEESGQGGGDQGESPAAEAGEAKSFKDIKSALTYVLMIYKNDGEPPEDETAGESDFQSGYGSR